MASSFSLDYEWEEELLLSDSNSRMDVDVEPSVDSTPTPAPVPSSPPRAAARLPVSKVSSVCLRFAFLSVPVTHATCVSRLVYRSAMCLSCRGSRCARSFSCVSRLARHVCLARGLSVLCRAWKRVSSRPAMMLHAARRVGDGGRGRGQGWGFGCASRRRGGAVCRGARRCVCATCSWGVVLRVVCCLSHGSRTCCRARCVCRFPGSRGGGLGLSCCWG